MDSDFLLELFYSGPRPSTHCEIKQKCWNQEIYNARFITIWQCDVRL